MGNAPDGEPVLPGLVLLDGECTAVIGLDLGSNIEVEFSAEWPVGL